MFTSVQQFHKNNNDIKEQKDLPVYIIYLCLEYIDVFSK